MKTTTLALIGFLLGCPLAWSADAPAPTLRFPSGAPQLNYLRIQPAQASPEPAGDPFSGRIAYDENRTSRVSSPVAGRVVRLPVQPGDPVKGGQPLLWLDSPDLGSAVADLRKAEADLRLKGLAQQRARTLYEGQVLARKDLEGSTADLEQSRAEAQRARARLRSLAPGGVPAKGGLYPLRAPLGGVVAERQVNPGAEVRPDNPAPLFVITDPAHLWAMIDLSERDLGKVRVGQPVAVEVDAYPGRRFTGRIASIGAALDPATRRVQVRATLDNPERLLKPEMYARITPLMEPARMAIQIPNAALITEGRHAFVFVETGPGVLEKRRVILSGQGRDSAVVAEGLKAGERVVTAGALLLNSELAGGK